MGKRKYASLQERIIANSVLSDDPRQFHGDTPCWNWIGQVSTSKTKYAQISIRVAGRHMTIRVARLALQVFRGIHMHEKLEADHLCFNTRCVNPMHLDPCSRRKNLKRRRNPGGHKRKEQTDERAAAQV